MQFIFTTVYDVELFDLKVPIIINKNSFSPYLLFTANINLLLLRSYLLFCFILHQYKMQILSTDQVAISIQ